MERAFESASLCHRHCEAALKFDRKDSSAIDLAGTKTRAIVARQSLSELPIPKITVGLCSGKRDEICKGTARRALN